MLPWSWRWGRRLLAIAVCVALFQWAFGLYTRDNDFPLSYHPEEPGKIKQLAADQRSFQHPGLLLETTALVLDFTQGPARQLAPAQRDLAAAQAKLAALTQAKAAAKEVAPAQREVDAAKRKVDQINRAVELSKARNAPRPSTLFAARDDQGAVEAGRAVSAAFAASAVVALALAAYLLAGVPGLLIAGPVVALCPSLLVHAHLMKEDTALVLGIAVTVLGAAMLAKLPSWLGQVTGATVLALGAALAASGQYVGVAALLLAAPVLLFALVRERWVLAALAGLAAMVVAAALGHRYGWQASPWLLWPLIAWGAALLVFWRGLIGQVLGLIVLGIVSGLAGQRGASLSPSWSAYLTTAAAWGAPAARCFYTAAVAAATGALLLVPLRAQWDRPLMRWLVFVPYLVAGAGAINYRIFAEYDRFENAVDLERTQAVTAHAGLTMAQPSGFFLRAVVHACTWPVLIGLGVYGLMLVLGFRRRTLTDWLLPLFGGAFLYVVSFGTMPYARYVLPVVVLAYVLAALGGASAIQQFGWRWWLRWPLYALLAAALLWPQWGRCRDDLDQFRNDSRRRLRQWVLDGGLPKGATILEDRDAALSGKPDRRHWPKPAELRVTVLESSNGPACDRGSLDELRTKGVGYVAVVDEVYGRYFELAVFPVAAGKEEYDRRRAWHERLFREGKLLWDSKPAHPLGPGTFVSPVIKVYDIRQAPATQPAATAPATRPAE